jgi:Fur family peroxide stress response transcriptional regulator
MEKAMRPSPADERAANREALEAELRRALEANGQRFTNQRLIVYEHLALFQASGHHPTAEDVFRVARPEMPSISLATVYKALEVLGECGLIQKLNFGDHCARYDFRVDQHHHARDITSGRILDIEGECDPKMLSGLKKPKGFKVVRCHIELEGYFEDAPGTAVKLRGAEAAG